MKLHAHTPTPYHRFTAHGPGHVEVDGKRHTAPLILAPDRMQTDWAVASFEALAAPHFEALLDWRPEVLLLGTGSRQQFAHPALFRALTEARIGVECMDTAAACRTYNILMSEGRRVIAAVFP